MPASESPKVRDVNANLITVGATLKEVMARLNQGIGGVVFMVDDDNVMLGLFTDGDIRRALLAGAALEDPADPHMTKSFVQGSVDVDPQENLKLLSPKIRHVPILDADGRPVSMMCWTDIWRLSVAEPTLGGNELVYVSDCLATNWISSQGEYVRRFEGGFADYLGGSVGALSTSSGTTALQLALAAGGITDGDEVIVPDLTFGASANAVIHAGAVPVFADVDPVTWTLDPVQFEKLIGPRTRAVMPVHLYGHPCDMDPILEIARRHDLLVVEDCAESLGARYKGRLIGTLGDVGCFSFFANKVITTGEGGMVVCQEPDLLARMRRLRDHGMSPERRYWHLEPGFNFRMTNLQAAIGLAQLERIDHFLAHRRTLAAIYDRVLGNFTGIGLPREADWAERIHWLYSITVEDASAGIDRDRLAEKLVEHGVETRPVFPVLHPQPAFAAYASGRPPADFAHASVTSESGLSLPTSNGMTAEQAETVANTVSEILADSRVLLAQRAS